MRDRGSSRGMRRSGCNCRRCNRGGSHGRRRYGCSFGGGLDRSLRRRAFDGGRRHRFGHRFGGRRHVNGFGKGGDGDLGRCEYDRRRRFFDDRSRRPKRRHRRRRWPADGRDRRGQRSGRGRPHFDRRGRPAQDGAGLDRCRGWRRRFGRAAASPQDVSHPGRFVRFWLGNRRRRSRTGRDRAARALGTVDALKDVFGGRHADGTYRRKGLPVQGGLSRRFPDRPARRSPAGCVARGELRGEVGL